MNILEEYFGLGGSTGGGVGWENESDVGGGPGELELTAGNKETCVLEVDDMGDADIVDSLLADILPPPGFTVISVHSPVGEQPGQAVSLVQTFTQVLYSAPHYSIVVYRHHRLPATVAPRWTS